MTLPVGSRCAACGVAALAALLGLALTGCPATVVTAVDAGRDAGPAPVDAPADTGGDLDTGSAFDAPSALDAPVASDSGPRADTPILPPVDAGDPFGDAGALGPPEWVPIDVLTMGTCTAFTPCGGDVVGTWDVTGACVEVPIPAALFDCPGATAVGTGMARGRVTFNGTTAVRTSQSVVSVEVFVPTLCAGFIGGCSGLETMLQASVPDSACVTETAGCRCAARQYFEIDDADGYTIVGNEIVSATLGKRWAYCITGGTLLYEDTTPPGGPAPREEGIIELGRR